MEIDFVGEDIEREAVLRSIDRLSTSKSIIRLGIAVNESLD